MTFHEIDRYEAESITLDAGRAVYQSTLVTGVQADCQYIQQRDGLQLPVR